MQGSKKLKWQPDEADYRLPLPALQVRHGVTRTSCRGIATRGFFLTCLARLLSRAPRLTPAHSRLPPQGARVRGGARNVLGAGEPGQGRRRGRAGMRAAGARAPLCASFLGHQRGGHRHHNPGAPPDPPSMSSPANVNLLKATSSQPGQSPGAAKVIALSLMDGVMRRPSAIKHQRALLGLLGNLLMLSHRENQRNRSVPTRAGHSDPPPCVVAGWR